MKKRKKGIEQYDFFIRNLNGDYDCIGCRLLQIDKKNKTITPGYMANYNKDYSGIGIRAHQIGVERMLQEKLDNVIINSAEDAFPFHYKCGFRAPSITLSYTEEQLFRYLNKWHQYTGLSWKDIIKNLKFKKQDSMYEVNYKTEENLFLEKVKQGCKSVKQTLYMWLEPSELDMWKSKARSQPILL